MAGLINQPLGDNVKRTFTLKTNKNEGNKH